MSEAVLLRTTCACARTTIEMCTLHLCKSTSPMQTAARATAPLYPSHLVPFPAGLFQKCCLCSLQPKICAPTSSCTGKHCATWKTNATRLCFRRHLVQNGITAHQNAVEVWSVYSKRSVLEAFSTSKKSQSSLYQMQWCMGVRYTCAPAHTFALDFKGDFTA